MDRLHYYRLLIRQDIRRQGYKVTSFLCDDISHAAEELKANMTGLWFWLK